MKYPKRTMLAAGLLTLALTLPASPATAAPSPVSAPPLASGATGSTFYVSPTGDDSRDGLSPETAWRTLGKVNAQTFGPGDSVLFAAGGSWNGQLSPSGSGSADAPITFSSYGDGERPLIAGGGAVESAIRIADQEHVIVSGFEVTNAGAGRTPRIGIQVTARDFGPVDDITIQNSFVHDIQGETSGPLTSNPSAGGIIVSALGTKTPTHYRDLLITGNEVADSRSYGIVTWSSWMQREGWNDLWDFMPVARGDYRPWTPSTGVKVVGNNVHDISAGGITVMQAAGALISGNRVHATAQNHGNVGIWWAGTDDIVVEYNEVSGTKYWGVDQDGNAFDADASAHRSIVQYNYSHDNEGGFFIAVSTGSAPAEAIIRYNVSRGDGNQVFAFSTNTKNIDVYNNTIWVTESDFIRGHRDRSKFSLVKVWRPVENVRFRNNIIHNAANLPYRDSDAVTFDRNLYFGGPVPAKDKAAISADPQLSAPAQPQSIADLGMFLPAASSPAINAGLTVPHNGGKDAVGTPLPAGMPDIGAIQRSAGEGRDEAAPQVVTSVGSEQATTPSAIADGSDRTPWASISRGLNLPVTMTLTFPSERRIAAVELATIFGTGQGITRLDLQVQRDGSWQTVAANAAITWTGSSQQVERRTVTLAEPVASSALRIIVTGANRTWGNIAVSEIGTIAPTD